MDAALYFIGALLAFVGGAFSFYFYAVSNHRMLYSQWWVPRVCQLDLAECVSIIKTKYGEIFGIQNALSGTIFLIAYGFALMGVPLRLIPEFIPFVMGAFTIIIGLYLVNGLFKLKTVCPICITVHVLSVVIFSIQLI